MSRTFHCERLTRAHDVAHFVCGQPSLDRYLLQVANQDAKRKISTTYVMVENASGAIAGFYTLSMTSIELTDLPPHTQKRLPRYPDVPAVLLGRLARDLRFKGRGCGDLLLSDALLRSGEACHTVAAFAMVVDAKYARAEAFYERFGFRPFPAHPGRMFLPMRCVEASLQSSFSDGGG